MKQKFLVPAFCAALSALALQSTSWFASPAWAACDPGDKLDKTTVEQIRAILTKAGYTKAHNWRKGCDNTWHVTATQDGAEVSVAVLPDGHVVREGD